MLLAALLSLALCKFDIAQPVSLDAFLFTESKLSHHLIAGRVAALYDI
jgi:hypothetical protein